RCSRPGRPCRREHGRGSLFSWLRVWDNRELDYYSGSLERVCWGMTSTYSSSRPVTMPAANPLILALALAASSVANAQQPEGAPLVAPFSAAKPGTALPSGWEVLSLGSTKTPTESQLREDARGRAR